MTREEIDCSEVLKAFSTLVVGCGFNEEWKDNPVMYRTYEVTNPTNGKRYRKESYWVLLYDYSDDIIRRLDATTEISQLVGVDSEGRTTFIIDRMLEC